MARHSASDNDAALLAALNPAQREAALALVGPVAILAGPGTGKTHTITHRIAYGVRAGVYDPQRLLALTFTNRAAFQLRNRLRALGASAVQARTFHAAALRQLSHFWPNTVGGTFPGIVSGKADLITEAADRLSARLSPQQVRAVAEEIEGRKVGELTLDNYSTRLADGSHRNDTGLATPLLDQLVRTYESVKETRGRLDFEDVLLATAGMLESEPWVTALVREQYRFFVVDEYQDISPLQHKLLRLWLGNRRDLCVVGDPAQTIYSFAGARAGYLTDFTTEFPEARAVRVEGSYRSAPPILAAANELARNIPHALSLTALRESGARQLPTLTHFADDHREAAGIAAAIKAERAAGTPVEDIAVLVRTNAQLTELARALGDAGVPYRLASGPSFFSRPEVRAVLAGIHAAVVAGQDDGPLFQVVSQVLQARGWRQQPPEQAGPERDVWQAMEAIMQLADAAAPGTTLAEFSAELRERAEHHDEPRIAAVTLSTMHAAKGLEWSSVYVAGLSEGLLPIANALDDAELLAEERRLFYVAITRARDRLRLSSGAGPHRASRFLAELGNRIRVAPSPCATAAAAH